MIVLITGGSGNGKSAYAEALVDRLPDRNRVYIATMQAFDEESVRRVERHRARRAGRHFVTLERPKDIGHADIPPGCVALLEDIPNLLANEMFDGGDAAGVEGSLRTLADRCRHLIMVTNDVFSDGAIYPEPTQVYLRRLAQINAAAARMADYVVEVVYSIPVPLKGEAPCIC